MEKIKMSALSPFGLTALKLDGAFSEVERLGALIEHLPLESEFELERALKLLRQFMEQSEIITVGVVEFARNLEAARARAEQAAATVAEVARSVQKRQDEKNAIQEKFAKLGAKVQAVNSDLATMRKASGEEFSQEEKIRIPERLMILDSRLGEFLEEAKALRTEAGEAKLKDVERNAESLYGVLRSTRGRLAEALGTVH